MTFSNFVVDARFGPNNDDVTPRSLQMDLPKGQLGAVQNATICTDAQFNGGNCAATSQIGQIAAYGKAVAAGFINIDVNATGGIFRLPETGTEAMRIGIVADDPMAQPIYMTGTMRIREDGSYGIRAFIPEMPNKATADMFGMSVDVDVRGPALEVFYNRDLRHRFDFETGEALSLDDEPVTAGARGV